MNDSDRDRENAPECESEAAKTVTQLIALAKEGDSSASERLIPLLYAELRRMARAQLIKRPPGNTLQPTALVHEAYLRLVGRDEPTPWNNRGHFFGAAAEAMRQILVEQARRKAALKRGGDRDRVDAREDLLAIEPVREDILILNEALTRLEQEDPEKAQIVKLRYFAGLTREETAGALSLSLRTCDRQWRYIVARLRRDVTGITGVEGDGYDG